MKTLTITFLLIMIGLNICQAQLDTGRVHVPPQSVIIHLHDPHSLANHKPLMIVQGKEVTDIDKLDPNSIQSMDVIGPKDPHRLAYGSKGQYGVILIELKPDSTFRKSPKQ